MIELLGITIHDPAVTLTDLGLGGLGAYLAWRLWRTPGHHTLLTSGTVLMAGLASAALWGALFHAAFPEGTATPTGFLGWVPVALSIVLAASAMLRLSLRLLLPELAPGASRLIVLAYALCFTAVVLLLSDSFSSIVYFYVPALGLLLLAAVRQATGGKQGWGLVAAGLVVSLLAALLQQLQVSVHPFYFDHNAVYHVVQGAALGFLYLGFRRAPPLGSS